MRRTGIGLMAFAAVLAYGATSTATTVNRCLARKIKSVGASTSTRARCYAKDASRPDPEGRDECLTKAADRFDGRGIPNKGLFETAERYPPCVTNDDQDQLNAKIADYAEALDDDVGNQGARSRCDGEKLRCIGTYVVSLVRCHSHAAVTDGDLDEECLARARLKLSDGERGCLEKVEAAGDCSVDGNPSELESEADDFMHSSLCALDRNGTQGCGPPTPTPTPSATPAPTAASGSSAKQRCVDEINRHRASIGLAPYARWTAAEGCADTQARLDSEANRAHSSFGRCGEFAQNECPNWPGPPFSMIAGCLQVMWNEGPGSDFSRHGHYINMSSTAYTKVACGFFTEPDGSVWAVQDFSY